MPSHERARLAMLVDSVWRMALRLGFRLARAWWHLRRPRHEGALVAIYVGQALLLVHSSYRDEWNFPGGSLEPGEAPEAAAHREFGTGEETGCISLNCTSIACPSCGLIIVRLSPRISHRLRSCRAWR
jgi:hypothetical protein